MVVHLRSGSFFGSHDLPRLAGGFRFCESAYAAGTRLPVHAHEEAHFCFVLDGGYRERIGRDTHVRGPRSLFWYPPDASHAEQHQSAGRHLLIEVAAERLEGMVDEQPLLREPLELHDEPTWIAKRIHVELQAPDDVSSLALEGLALDLLTHAWRKGQRGDSKRPPAWVGHVDEILSEAYQQPPTHAELAHAVGVHPAHLARTYRRHRGRTIGGQIRLLRVRRAGDLLARSSLGLAQVAQAAGFADQSHLTRVFRELVGTTPRRFRDAQGG